MRHSPSLRLLLLLGAAGAVLLSPAIAVASKVAVLPAQVDESSRDQVPKLFDDYVLTAVQNLGDLEVVGQEDIATILGFEQQKDIFNCDDTSCIADIGGALGVDKIMVVKIAKLGADWIATAKLINIKETRVESRLNEIVRGDTKALLEAVPGIVGKLFKRAAASAPPRPAASDDGDSGRPSKSDGPTSRPSRESRPYDSSYGDTQRVAGVVLLVGGAVLAAVGGILLTAVLPTGSGDESEEFDADDNYGCYYDSTSTFLCYYTDPGVYSSYDAYAENGCSDYSEGDFDGEGCPDENFSSSTAELETAMGYTGATFLVVAGLVLEGVGAKLRVNGAAKAELSTDSASGSSPLLWVGWGLTLVTLGAPVYGFAAEDAFGASIWGWTAGGLATVSFLLGAFVGNSAEYAAITPTPTIMYARTQDGGTMPTFGFSLGF